MPFLEATLSLPHSVVLILDPAVGEPPEAMDGRLVSASGSCVAVGALSEADGPTRIVLGDVTGPPLDEALSLRWTGEIETGGTVAVTTVLGDVVLRADSPSRLTLEVWTNDVSEPDLIYVVPRPA